jgi:hypothetical protein
VLDAGCITGEPGGARLLLVRSFISGAMIATPLSLCFNLNLGKNDVLQFDGTQLLLYVA